MKLFLEVLIKLALVFIVLLLGEALVVLPFIWTVLVTLALGAAAALWVL